MSRSSILFRSSIYAGFAILFLFAAIDESNRWAAIFFGILSVANFIAAGAGFLLLLMGKEGNEDNQ